MADRCLLYYITDRSQFPGREADRRDALLHKIAEAASAGVDYIQLREKDLSGRELEALTLQAMAAMRANSSSTRLLVNSRTDIALSVDADGVHLQANDVAPNDLRKVLEVFGQRPPAAPRFLVAASCHSIGDVIRAESEKVDFAVFAPVFGKSTFLAALPTGIEALREACQVKILVFALGGVTAENAADCRSVGAAGVAGIRLFQQNNIDDVVRVLRSL